MIEELSMMPSDCRWEMGGGHWHVLLNSTSVEGKKKVSRLGGV